jgi:hypothetical protein
VSAKLDGEFRRKLWYVPYGSFTGAGVYVRCRPAFRLVLVDLDLGAHSYSAIPLRASANESPPNRTTVWVKTC